MMTDGTGLMLTLYQDLRLWLGSLQAPQHCTLCRQASPQLICPLCCSALPQITLADEHSNLLLQPKVSCHLNNIAFEQLYVPYRYEWPINFLLKQLKFNRRLIYAKVLAELFVAKLRQDAVPLPQALVAVPLHQQRIKKRHYNQSEELATYIARALAIPLLKERCQRRRNTAPQTAMSGAARRRNLCRSFHCNLIEDYQHIAIVDDVLTTGATADALYRAIVTRNPSLQVDVWSIAMSLADQ